MLELSLVKLSRPELELVKLSRPGWFVPNLSDLVKAKALQQKEDLPKNFFSKFRKEVRAAVCLASLRGRSKGATLPTVNTCPVCDAVLDTPIRVRAHLQGEPDKRGRSSCSRFVKRVAAERRASEFWIPRLDRAIEILLPDSHPNRRLHLAQALHQAVRAFDFDPATVALSVQTALVLNADAEFGDQGDPFQIGQDRQGPSSQVEQTFGQPLEELSTPSTESFEEGRQAQCQLEDGTGERPQAHQAVEGRGKKRPRRESVF